MLRQNNSSLFIVSATGALCTDIVLYRSSFDRCFGTALCGASNSYLLPVLRNQSCVHKSQNLQMNLNIKLLY